MFLWWTKGGLGYWIKNGLNQTKPNNNIEAIKLIIYHLPVWRQNSKRVYYNLYMELIISLFHFEYYNPGIRFTESRSQKARRKLDHRAGWIPIVGPVWIQLIHPSCSLQQRKQVFVTNNFFLLFSTEFVFGVHKMNNI